MSLCATSVWGVEHQFMATSPRCSFSVETGDRPVDQGGFLAYNPHAAHDGSLTTSWRSGYRGVDPTTYATVFPHFLNTRLTYDGGTVQIARVTVIAPTTGYPAWFTGNSEESIKVVLNDGILGDLIDGPGWTVTKICQFTPNDTPGSVYVVECAGSAMAVAIYGDKWISQYPFEIAEVEIRGP